MYNSARATQTREGRKPGRHKKDRMTPREQCAPCGRCLRAEELRSPWQEKSESKLVSSKILKGQDIHRQSQLEGGARNRKPALP